jgi:hypothetical protein
MSVWASGVASAVEGGVERRLQLRGERVGDLDLRGGCVEGVAREVACVRGLVPLEDLALPVFEHRLQRVEARAQALDLRRVEMDRVGELAVRELAARAVHQHVVEHRVGRVARARFGRRRKLHRVVAEVGVRDATVFAHLPRTS